MILISMRAFLLKRVGPPKLFRYISTVKGATFGLLFDIDGVLVRSNRVLPSVKETFSRLVDSKGKFRVPTLFVTNAGNKLRHQKAAQLTNWLDVEVNEDQVVMAHSPLSMLTTYHQKHALISGQGPVEDIAKSLGFSSVITMEQVRDTFPSLDAVDHEHYRPVLSESRHHFKPIEVIILFGEPVRWETSLQLLVDLLLTNGMPTGLPSELIYPHIPIIACNMDLQWMAEANMPRFGHGAFLLCLENLYKKITNRDLIYTALVGKPSEITYHHAHRLIMRQAEEIGIVNQVKTLYAIGDNINTDIYGANLYNQYLIKNPSNGSKSFPRVSCPIETMQGDRIKDPELGSHTCLSVLVETGLFSPDHQASFMSHSPRDFLPVDEGLIKPNFIAKDVYHAIDVIFSKQSYN
ncbi:haloacid dehalogenase-like hydrolase domain-containing 5 isoform X2 [Ischnura elegans]|uniref:haloacid dehalogenase-like hydrolase domain-containing 5 isoform X2 n=1 Tax=Ischnura elegans TaxID=197161 RepID=UPI001ED87A59|nr:haloacid dehalogenase-like hydrolase domain-containing 5 isoform X2 [Ischnura elegans]